MGVLQYALHENIGYVLHNISNYIHAYCYLSKKKKNIFAYCWVLLMIGLYMKGIAVIN